MIEKISNDIARFFVKNQIIKDEDTEIYSFGVQSFLEMMLGVLTLLIFSLILNRTIETALFLLSLIPLRSYAGGYHAKSFGSCYFISVASYLLTIFFITFLPEKFYVLTAIFSVLITMPTIFLLSPLDSENKRLFKEEKIRYRKISLVLVSLYVIAIIFTYAFLSLNVFIISFCLGGVFTSISLIISKIKE